MAKLFGPKFDVISPVWLQVRRIGDGQYEVQGTHDIDQGWVKDVRKATKHKNKGTTISNMPRKSLLIVKQTNYSSAAHSLR